MKDRKKIKEIIKKYMFILFLVVVTIAAIAVVVLYQIKGETNMPYHLSKIIITSTAEGIKKETEENLRWHYDIAQDNDIRIYIDKNDNFADDRLLESVVIDNIEITKKPKKGEIKTYMPSAVGDLLFKNEDRYLIDSSLEFRGAKENNSKKLEIGSKGGEIAIRFANINLAEYASNDFEINEIKHDGTLLEKAEVNEEDIKFEISFNITIKVNGIRYRGKIELELPAENLIKNGTAQLEITDFTNYVFKRI